MEIIKYTPALRSVLEEMLVEYFIVDLQSDIPEAVIRGKLLDFIERNADRSINHIALVLDRSIPVGFSIYQIDSELSDWCKRPGWGFIREFFIRRDFRGKGFGKALALYTERQLHDLGAAQLYLTSDSAIGFWERCGWRNSHEICSNDLEILTK